MCVGGEREPAVVYFYQPGHRYMPDLRELLSFMDIFSLSLYKSISIPCVFCRFLKIDRFAVDVSACWLKNKDENSPPILFELFPCPVVFIDVETSFFFGSHRYNKLDDLCPDQVVGFKKKSLNVKNLE